MMVTEITDMLKNIDWFIIFDFKFLQTIADVSSANFFKGTAAGEISSDLYRASLCDIKETKVRPFELEKNR